jgi:hypothetical protein
MESQEDYKQTLTDIRNLMAHSARFHSLSGLAGISSGIFALAGVTIFCLRFGFGLFDPLFNVSHDAVSFLLWDGLVVLLCSLLSAFWFTRRNAAKNGEKLWTPLFRRILLYWSLPMIAGGILLLAFFGGNEAIQLPTAIALTLVFYGLALVNASRFSLDELFRMGILQLTLGLIAFFLWQYSLVFWAAGFGFVNLIYGIILFSKYERNRSKKES